MLMFYLQLIETESDRQLFAQLYHEHKKQMHFVANGVLRNESLAEDAVHSAFVGIANNMKSLHNRSQTDIKNYVLKAAKNTAINLLKKERQQRELLPELETEPVEDSVLEAFCTRENYAAVVDAIFAMDEPYSTVLYYHFVMELDSREIASTLHRKPDAVRQQLFRGKKLLYDRLKGGCRHV